MSDIKEIRVKITADASGLEDGKKNVDGMAGSLDGLIDKLGPTALIGAATLAGKAILDLGMKWDESSANMAKATGKTGDELKAMNDSLATVMATSEFSVEDVSNAMAKLSSSFDLSGQDLESLTAAMSDFADVTNTDLTQAVTESSGAVKAWGIEAKAIPGYLDAVTVAMQKTGGSASQINALMERASPIFKSFGLSAKDALGILSTFEKNGVNSEKAIAGLNTALAKFSAEGVKDAGIALTEVYNRIRELGPGADSTRLAIETFGSKAGAGLADAIHKGNMSLYDMQNALGDTTGALARTAKASETTADKMAVGMNKMGAAVGPVAKSITDVLGNAIGFLGDQFAKMQLEQSLALAKMAGNYQEQIKIFKEMVKGVEVGSAEYAIALSKIDGAAQKVVLTNQALETSIKNANKAWGEGINTGRGKQLSEAQALAEFEKKQAIEDADNAAKSKEDWAKTFQERVSNFELMTSKLASLRLANSKDEREKLKMSYAQELETIDKITELGPQGKAIQTQAKLELEKKYQADLEELSKKEVANQNAVNALIIKSEEDKLKAIKSANDYYANYEGQAEQEDADENAKIKDEEIKTTKSANDYYANYERQAEQEDADENAKIKDEEIKKAIEYAGTISGLISSIGSMGSESSQAIASSAGELVSLGTNVTKVLASGFTDINAIMAVSGQLIKMAFGGNQAAADKFMGAIGKIVDLVGDVLTSVFVVLGVVFDGIANTINGIAWALEQTFIFAGMVGQKLWEAFEPLRAVLQPVWDLLNGIWNIIKSIFDFFAGIGNSIGGFFSGIGNGIWDFMSASGTTYSPGGIGIVGEQGPEIVKLPAGAQITPNHQMKNGSMGTGTTINIYSPTTPTPLETSRILTQTMRNLAFEGAI